VSCGAVHSQARELVAQGHAATLVAATLLISRSSLDYQKKPRGSRADRRYDEPIVLACREKVTCGFGPQNPYIREEENAAGVVRQPLGGPKTIKNIEKIAGEPVSRNLRAHLYFQ
jgi:hypothetical protein